MLNIIPIDKKKKRSRRLAKIPEGLPKPPFRWSIIGASHSGKTNMLCNLFRKNFYGKFWKKDNIFVFSPTVELDDKLKECIPSNNFYDEFNPEILQEIYDQQHGIKKTLGPGKMPDVLVILDDCLGTGAFQRNSIITKYIHKTRHYKVSMIYTSQLLKGLGTNIRANSDVISIFRCTNFSEVDKILDETSDKQGRKRMRDILVKIFEIPYNFLHINYQVKDLKKRYTEGFIKHVENPFFTDVK